MVKNGYYGNEGFGLAWDRIEVQYTNLFITTGTKFQLKLTIFILGTNLLKKGISGLRKKNRSFAYAHGRYLLY